MENKKCGCGRSFHELPEDVKVNEWGLWFNCECGSTAFIPMTLVDDAYRLTLEQMHRDVKGLSEALSKASIDHVLKKYR